MKRALFVAAPLLFLGACAGPSQRVSNDGSSIAPSNRPRESDIAAKSSAPALEPVACDITAFALHPLGGSAPLGNVDAWGSSAPIPGSDKDHPILRCGHRDSYRFVAGIFRCADGKNPLDGDWRAGGQARRGNVGHNSSGHIIDLYIVPCAGGPEEVFVDLYGCPEETGETPANHPSDPNSAWSLQPIPPTIDKLIDEAGTLADSKQYGEAIAKVEQAIAETRTAVGSLHPHLGVLFDLLGLLQERAGLSDQAERSWRTAYPLWQKASWPSIPPVGNTLRSLGLISMKRHELDQAACLLQHGVAVYAAAKGPVEVRVPATLIDLATVYRQQGHLERAELLFKRAVRLIEIGQGPRHLRVAESLTELAGVYDQMGDKAQAAATRSRAQQIEALK